MHARHAAAHKGGTRTSVSLPLSLSLTHSCAQIHDLTVGRRAVGGDSLNNIKLGFKPVCENSSDDTDEQQFSCSVHSAYHSSQMHMGVGGSKFPKF